MTTANRVPTIGAILEDPEWGSECPVCGDEFTTTKSGIVWPETCVIRDAFAWDRVCQAPPPDAIQDFIERMDVDNEYPALAMAYVHTVSDTA